MKAGKILLTAALAGLAAVAFAGLGATQAIAKNCELSISEQRSFGPDYVIDLQAKKVSCRKAKKVVRAFHDCRYEAPKPGLDGRCTSRVRKFKCDEAKRNKLAGAQYHTTVRCERGNAKVVHVYQQSY